MDRKAVRKEALGRALEQLTAEGVNAAPVRDIEPHEATCPACGHTWMMGEEGDDDGEAFEGED